jgi:hypothetical protein
MRTVFLDLEKKRPLLDSNIEAFKNLRQQLLELHVLPMLKTKAPRQYLVFLTGITETCVDRPPLKLTTLCSVMRALALVARKAAHEGSCQLLRETICCVMSIAKIPAACVNSEATGWLLDWSKNAASVDEEYFWLSFQYHEAFYRTLFSVTHEEQLSHFDSDDVWPLVGIDRHMGSKDAERLRTLERERYGVLVQVKNVYRKETCALTTSRVNLACRSDDAQGLNRQVSELLRRAKSIP